MKLIDLHKEWCGNKRLKEMGLCNSIPREYRKHFDLFYPDEFLKNNTCYWASEMYSQPVGGKLEDKEMFNYGRLRQTIVLLICAMNNEL